MKATIQGVEFETDSAGSVIEPDETFLCQYEGDADFRARFRATFVLIADDDLEYCECCKRMVPASDMGAIRTAPATHSSPAEYDAVCEPCIDGLTIPEWDADEEAA